MPVSVVVGGQFGSEGKGKVAHFLAMEHKATLVVRVGGSNSGHTVVCPDGRYRIFRHLPTAAILDGVVCMLGPGCYIDPEVLLNEVEEIGLSPQRLRIDPNASVITEDHKTREQARNLGVTLGSTQSGTGEAVADRIRRTPTVLMAKDHPLLKRFIRHGPVRRQLRTGLKRDERVVIEGTQGFGLSVLQSRHYPKTTSRDTTAAAFVSEAGISPRDVDEVVMVLRAFPIRVAGDSGDLPLETTWETVAKAGGWPEGALAEHTSVTGQLRRVADFDSQVVLDAIEANAPDRIVLNHADYFDVNSRGCIAPTAQVLMAVKNIQRAIGQRIALIGLGPDNLVSNSAPYSLVQGRLSA